MLFQSASGILNNAISRTLSENFGQSKRTLVTEQTYKNLEKIIPERIDIGQGPPYQKWAMCYDHALDILLAHVADVHVQTEASPSSSTPLLGQFWEQVKKKIGGSPSYDQEELPSNGEELLSKFNENGFLVLRGLGLGAVGDDYRDHAVLVFSVSKINVPSKGPRVVAGVIDCNDQARDPETMASREAAAKMGKSHVSELTHEEANKNGAHLRRIRFMDGDALLKHMWKNIRQSEQLIESMMVGVPHIAFPLKKVPTLTADEADGLSKILVEIYDTPEVEKFEDQDFGRSEDEAAAQRSAGGAMARQLYKAAKERED